MIPTPHMQAGSAETIQICELPVLYPSNCLLIMIHDGDE